jgi:aryl-alcohol dehydrogenase-like predicted oxidoreductase
MTLGSTVDETQAYAIMSRAFELGINFFDNAEMYASKWGKPY